MNQTTFISDHKTLIKLLEKRIKNFEKLTATQNELINEMKNVVRTENSIEDIRGKMLDEPQYFKEPCPCCTWLGKEKTQWNKVNGWVDAYAVHAETGLSILLQYGPEEHEYYTFGVESFTGETNLPAPAKTALTYYKENLALV